VVLAVLYMGSHLLKQLKLLRSLWLLSLFNFVNEGEWSGFFRLGLLLSQ